MKWINSCREPIEESSLDLHNWLIYRFEVSDSLKALAFCVEFQSINGSLQASVELIIYVSKHKFWLTNEVEEYKIYEVS